MQKDHEAYKAESGKRFAASQEECQQLRERAEAASSEVAGLQEKLTQLEQSGADASSAQAHSAIQATVRPCLWLKALIRLTCPANGLSGFMLKGKLMRVMRN